MKHTGWYRFFTTLAVLSGVIIFLFGESDVPYYMSLMSVSLITFLVSSLCAYIANDTNRLFKHVAAWILIYQAHKYKAHRSGNSRFAKSAYRLYRRQDYSYMELYNYVLDNYAKLDNIVTDDVDEKQKVGC